MERVPKGEKPRGVVEGCWGQWGLAKGLSGKKGVLHQKGWKGVTQGEERGKLGGNGEPKDNSDKKL